MQKQANISFKPNKFLFIFYRFLPIVVICLVIMVIILPIIILMPDLPEMMTAIAFFVFGCVIICLFFWWFFSFDYKKTLYTFDKEEIIYKTGSIFSDKKTNLPIKNITHLKLQLPFISHYFFKTGNISIETAGSGKTEGRLIALENPKEVYKKIQDLMKNNGFSLQKTKLEKKMKPNMLAVVFDSIKSFIILVVVLVFFLVPIFTEDSSHIKGNALTAIIVIWGIISTIMAVVFIFKYLDLKRRVYKIYNDTIAYKEGFLTKNYSLIPFENLTDSSSTQGVVDRIFGFYDVMISCQGMNKEILFKNITEGKTVSESIRVLIKDFKKNKVAKIHKKVEKIKHEIDFNTSFVDDFKMNPLRAMIFFVVFLCLFIIGFIFVSHEIYVFFTVFIIYAIKKIIEIIATNYKIKKDSIQYCYKFIKTKNVEFINDKITNITFAENLIDKVFGTCKISFSSIGSSGRIEFKYISKQEKLYDNILSKIGIKNKKIKYELLPKFGFFVLIKSFFLYFFVLSYVFILLFLLLELHIFTILAFVLGYIYSIFYYKNAGIYFYKNYLCIEKGLITKSKSYSSYENIKNITTVKYPLTKIGKLCFGVAGGNKSVDLSANSSSVNRNINIPNISKGINKLNNAFNLSLSFIENIPLQNNILDFIVKEPMTKSEISKKEKLFLSHAVKSKFVEKQDLGNSLFLPVFFFIFFCFVIVMNINEIVLKYYIGYFIYFILGIIALIVRIKMISYEIQFFRIIKKSGIFYKTQVSIIFSKIDHVNKNQGLVNKIFDNGNIFIQTVASEETEMAINNVSNYQEFYEKLRER